MSTDTTTQNTTESTTTTLQDVLAPIAARLAAVQADKAALEEQEKALKAAIRDLVQADPGTYAAGALQVQLQPNRRFDPEVAIAHLSAEQKDACHRTVLDPALVKRHLTPAQLDEAMVVVGEPKVVLR